MKISTPREKKKVKASRTEILHKHPKIIKFSSLFMTVKNKDFSLSRSLNGQNDFRFPTQQTEWESKYGSEEQEGPQASPKHTEQLQLLNFLPC